MYIALNTNNATDFDLFSVAETILLHVWVQYNYDMYMYVLGVKKKLVIFHL